MPKLSLHAGTTSKSVGVFVQDSSSVVGAGLAGLTASSSGLLAFWYFPGFSAHTLPLVALAAPDSAWTSGGFKEVTNTWPGHYRLDLPNACLTGATSVIVGLLGAPDMAPVSLEIELTATDNQSGGGGLTLDLTQAVPTTNTAQTVGDCLNAARAQGFGKWAISGTTLTLYAANGTTAVRTFTLDSATAPTSRT